MGQAHCKLCIAQCGELLVDQERHQIHSQAAHEEASHDHTLSTKELADNVKSRGSEERCLSEFHKQASQSSFRPVELQTLSVVPSSPTCAVDQLQRQLQLREQTIDALRKDASQRDFLVLALENHCFQKEETIAELKKQSFHDEVKSNLQILNEAGMQDLQAIRRQIEDKEDQILALQQRVAGDEETLKSVIAETRAKGEAVDGLLCSLTRQVQMREEAQQKIRHLQDKSRDNDDNAIALLKAEVRAPNAEEAVLRLKRQLNEKELKIKTLQDEVDIERAALASTLAASTKLEHLKSLRSAASARLPAKVEEPLEVIPSSASSAPSQAKAEEPSEELLKHTRRLSEQVVAGAVCASIIQVALVKLAEPETAIVETAACLIRQTELAKSLVRLAEPDTVVETAAVFGQTG